MANSIRVMALASQIMRRYDRNDDGVIDLKGNDRAYDADQLSEAVVANRQIISKWRNLGGRYRDAAETFWEDRVDLSNLFRAADTNQDQVVERDELLGIIRLFDENGDDRISADPHNHWSELKQLQRKYPEVSEQGYFRLKWKSENYVDPHSHGVDISTDIYELR